jgi:hypothetical protein
MHGKLNLFADFWFPKNCLLSEDVDLHVTYPDYLNLNSKNLKVFYCSNEPWVLRKDFLSWNKISLDEYMSYLKKYDLILTHDKFILDAFPQSKLHCYGTSWLEPINNKEKNFNISFMTTSKNTTKNHNFRLNIYDNYDKINIPKTFYESIKQPYKKHFSYIDVDKKHELFNTHMFSIIVENCTDENYFTEKLIDCLLCKTVPVYCGCANIDDYFDGTGIIKITPENYIEVINNLTPADYNIDVVNKNYIEAQKWAGGPQKRVLEDIKKHLNVDYKII